MKTLLRFMLVGAIFAMAYASTAIAGSAQEPQPSPIPQEVINRAAPTPGADWMYFEETGHNLQGDFMFYWRDRGGLPIFGFPITEPFEQELVVDGKTVKKWVQYFERARFELNPGAEKPWNVLLGHFGWEIARHIGVPQEVINRAAPTPGADWMYFEETGHNLQGDFMFYWRDRGGLPIFGFPITEPFEQELVVDGKTVKKWVQYFERARFELNPGAEKPWNVLLGHFGWEIIQLYNSPGTPSQGDCVGVPAGTNDPDRDWPIQHGGPKILNVWSPALGDGLFKLLLAAGENPTFTNVGGDATFYPAGCESVAQEEFNQNPNAAISLAQLAEAGLVKGSEPPTPPAPVCEVVGEESKADPNTEWYPDYQGRVAIVEFWNTETPQGKVLYTILKVDQPVVLLGGGYIWYYPADCFEAASEQYHAQKNAGNRIPTSVEELITAGYARWP